MRALNRHTAEVAGIEPGAIGDVNGSHACIQAMLAGGLLVPMEGALTPPHDPSDELADRDARIAALVEELTAAQDEVAGARSRIAELEAIIEGPAPTATSAPAAPSTADAAKPPRSTRVARDG